MIIRNENNNDNNNNIFPDTNARIICYFTNWAGKRRGRGRFEPSNLDPSKCSHIVYAFAGIKDNQLVPTEEKDEINEGGKGILINRENIHQYGCYNHSHGYDIDNNTMNLILLEQVIMTKW